MAEWKRDANKSNSEAPWSTGEIRQREESAIPKGDDVQPNSSSGPQPNYAHQLNVTQPNAPRPNPSLQPQLNYTQQHNSSKQSNSSCPQPLYSRQSTRPVDSSSAVEGRRRKQLIIIIAIVMVIVVVAATIFIVNHNVASSATGAKTMSKSEAYGSMFPEDRYDLQDPMLEVPNTQAFAMKVTQEALDKYATSTTVGGCEFLCVYGDPSLDVPVPIVHHFDKDSGILTAQGAAQPDASNETFVGMGWSGFKGYWLVQWMDEKGNTLQKPKLTYFTVADEKRSDLPAPEGLQLSVDGDGILRIKWKPVQGAKKYRAYLISNNTALSKHTIFSLFDTDKTDVRLDEMGVLEPGLDTTCGGYGQEECTAEEKEQNGNSALEGLVEQSQDDADKCAAATEVKDMCRSDELEELYNRELSEQFLKEFDPDMDVSKGWIGITAIDDKIRESYITTSSLESLAGSIYVKEAWGAGWEAKYHLGSYATMTDDEKKAFSKLYATMLDGRTHAIYKVCEKTGVDEYGHVDVECRAPGTPYKDDDTFDDERYLNDYQTNVAQWRKEEPKSSLMPVNFKEALGKLSKADSQPLGKNGVEKYDPFGSTEYSKYVAENMLALHRSIDITDYSNSPSSPSAYSVVSEIIDQNPYLHAISNADGGCGIAYSKVVQDERTYLKVEYAADAQKIRDEFYDAVTKAASHITAGATRAGAIQIDNYLASIAEYDYDAFNFSEEIDKSNSDQVSELYEKYPRSWSTGVLMQGKGVCASYAQSFNAIARQVGIQSVYVTGQGDGGSHAWNRVQLDGQWLDIDPTWDDDGSYASAQYQLKPANTLDKHTTEGDWMIPANIRMYGGTR